MTRKLTATFLLVAMMANGAYAQAAPRTTAVPPPGTAAVPPPGPAAVPRTAAVPAADVAASRRDDRAGETPARQPARTPAVPARRPAPASTLTESHIFGPTRYVRTNGAKNEYRNTITVPAWIASPYRLHVQNSNVSSATVRINGTDVLTQSDFNPNVTVLDRTVTL